jgi:hypothetical protein
MKKLELLEGHTVDHLSSHLRAYSPDKIFSILREDIRNAQDGESDRERYERNGRRETRPEVIRNSPQNKRKRLKLQKKQHLR